MSGSENTLTAIVQFSLTSTSLFPASPGLQEVYATPLGPCAIERCNLIEKYEMSLPSLDFFQTVSTNTEFQVPIPC